jgi:hypothetical protein
MFNYITRATAFLAIAILDTATAIRNNDKWYGLHRLYYSKGHEVTDVQTKCNQVIEGDPKECMIVCVEVTSIRNGDELVNEYSRVSERKCGASWEHDGHDGDDKDWKGHTKWPTYSPTQFPTYYLTESVDNGHGADAKWTGDGHECIIDWTDDAWTSSMDESPVSGGSKGSKSGGYLEGSSSGYSKNSKSKGRYSKSSKSKSGKGGIQSKTLNSKGGKGGSQSKSLKVHYFDNVKGGGGSSYSKSSKSSGAGDVDDRDATTLEPTPNKWEAPSWSSGAGIDKGDKGLGSSKSSKPESTSWPSSAGAIKEVDSSGSSKSSKLAGNSREWESAKWSGGGLVKGGKGSGSSKSSKPAEGSSDVLDGKGSSSPETVPDGESGRWSGGVAL